jgi:hypothetical protein
MQLRYLQTLTEIGAEQNSTIIFPLRPCRRHSSTNMWATFAPNFAAVSVSNGGDASAQQFRWARARIALRKVPRP